MPNRGSKMNKKQFKIWLIENDFNQITLSKKLGLTPTTIGNYVRADRFPVVFQLALKTLEKQDK